MRVQESEGRVYSSIVSSFFQAEHAGFGNRKQDVEASPRGKAADDEKEGFAQRAQNAGVVEAQGCKRLKQKTKS